MVVTKDHIKWQKIPCLPPIFPYNKFVTDSSKKEPISLILFQQNSLQLLKIPVFPSSTNHITDQYLSNIEFTKDDIKRIICKLDPNKAHGHDRVSIRILKMSGDAIIESVFKIFKNLEFFQITGKKETLYRFLKKATSKTSKTIVQSFFFESVPRFLNVSFTISC